MEEPYALPSMSYQGSSRFESSFSAGGSAPGSTSAVAAPGGTWDWQREMEA